MTTVLSKKGQISLPEPVREQLHLVPGDDFEIFVEDNDTITLHRISQPANCWAARLNSRSPFEKVTIPNRQPCELPRGHERPERGVRQEGQSPRQSDRDFWQPAVPVGWENAVFLAPAVGSRRFEGTFETVANQKLPISFRIVQFLQNLRISDLLHLLYVYHFNARRASPMRPSACQSQFESACKRDGSGERNRGSNGFRTCGDKQARKDW